jgi:hypothetical protein
MSIHFYAISVTFNYASIVHQLYAQFEMIRQSLLLSLLAMTFSEFQFPYRAAQVSLSYLFLLK